MPIKHTNVAGPQVSFTADWEKPSEAVEHPAPHVTDVLSHGFAGGFAVPLAQRRHNLAMILQTGVDPAGYRLLLKYLGVAAHFPDDSGQKRIATAARDRIVQQIVKRPMVL